MKLKSTNKCFKKSRSRQLWKRWEVWDRRTNN